MTKCRALGIMDMIDQRLIDYSEGYGDYGDRLRTEGAELTLGDLLLILEGFLMKYRRALTQDENNDGNRGEAAQFEKDSALILHLFQALKLGGVYNAKY